MFSSVLKERSSENADAVRFKELDSKKNDAAIEMMKRAWKAGIRAAYALCDTWYTSEKFIHDVRTIGGGKVHFLGMAKMGKHVTRYADSLRMPTNSLLAMNVPRQRTAGSTTASISTLQVSWVKRLYASSL